MEKTSRIQNYLTIDVEEYFQVAAFDKVVDFANWPVYESRVVDSTNEILSLLDKFTITATFFIVGWVAERNPTLVKNIQERGHEIGCHSYAHKKVYDLTPEQFRQDTKRAKEILENITGKQVQGYRAPSYSITNKSLWAFDILQDLGFTYDSSIFPIYHDNYGIPNAPRFPYRLKEHDLIEYPISTVHLFGKNIPISGGGYFRLFPYWFTKFGLNTINKKEGKPFIFYLHPWELDPDQPKFTAASRFSKFRHYNKLEMTKGRIIQLLTDFQFGEIIS